MDGITHAKFTQTGQSTDFGAQVHEMVSESFNCLKNLEIQQDHQQQFFGIDDKAGLQIETYKQNDYFNDWSFNIRNFHNLKNLTLDLQSLPEVVDLSAFSLLKNVNLQLDFIFDNEIENVKFKFRQNSKINLKINIQNQICFNMKLKPSLINWLSQINETEQITVNFKTLEIDQSDFDGSGKIAALSKKNDKYVCEMTKSGKSMKFKFVKIQLDIKVKEIIIV